MNCKFLISINSPIAPGDTETPMLTEDARKRGISWEEYIADAADRPLTRIGASEEIAKAALFLAFEDSSFVTDMILTVDGSGTAD